MSFVALVVATLLLSGCSAWERKLAFQSPSSRATVEIQQPFPANGWGVRILLANKGNVTTLYQLRGDVFLDFVDVAWFGGDQGLAVFSCGTPPLRIGYRVTEGKFFDFETAKSMVARHIVTEYGLKPENEQGALDWACSPSGREAFLRLHPEAHPR